MNYKYRMHDPRIGRFFAVDPLASKYPHNSSYAFSENSTIAFIELEGLERFYAADGVLFDRIGTDNTIYIVSADKIDAVQKNIDWANHQISIEGQYIQSNKKAAIQNSTSITSLAGEERYQELSNVLTTIYKDGGGKVSELESGSISIYKGRDDIDWVYGPEMTPFNYTDIEVSSTDRAWGWVVYEKSIQGADAFQENGNVYYNASDPTGDYSYIYHTLAHERMHLVKGAKYDYYGGGKWGEFNVHFAIMQLETYSNATMKYRKNTLSALESNLTKQRDYILGGNASDTSKVEYRKNYTKFKNEYKKHHKKEYSDDKFDI